PLTLRGQVFMDGRLDLQGAVQLSPEAASLLVGNAVKMTEPVPVALRVGGEWRRPSITPTELAHLAPRYATAYAQSAGGRAVTDKAQQAAEALKKKTGLEKVPTSGAEAQAAAKAAAERAQAQAAERAQKLKEQAEAEKRAAEERVRQEAEKAKQEA